MHSLHFKVIRSISLLLVGMCVAWGQLAFAQAGSQEHLSQTDQTSQDKAVEREGVEDATPELGVLVAQSPGRGVLVAEVVTGSPADIASIRPGDYILSVDGEEVSTPGDLRRVVRTKEVAREIQIVVWRAGNETTQSIVLARRAPEHSVGRAWLGVVLSQAESEGARIDRVYPRSPADQAGLRAGDIVTGANGRQIASIVQMINLIEEFEPAAKIELSVLREGRKLVITATLGTAPGSWPRTLLRPPLRPFELPDAPTWLRDPRRDRQTQLEEMLEELRLEVQALREQVRELSGQSAEPHEKAHNPGDHPNNPGVHENNPDSAPRGTRSSVARGREYYQDYGHYYRFQRPPSRSFRSRDYLWRQPPARYYSYYPYTPPPYGYYHDEGRTYYYLAPEGPRFGARIGHYWFEYW